MKSFVFHFVVHKFIFTIHVQCSFYTFFSYETNVSTMLRSTLQIAHMYYIHVIHLIPYNCLVITWYVWNLVNTTFAAAVVNRCGSLRFKPKAIVIFRFFAWYVRRQTGSVIRIRYGLVFRRPRSGCIMNFSLAEIPKRWTFYVHFLANTLIQSCLCLSASAWHSRYH